MYCSYGKGTPEIYRDYHIWQSSNVKLFSAQRRRETAKLLQFLELMKTMFDCGENTTQRSAGVRHHEGNSVDPRKDDFLKAKDDSDWVESTDNDLVRSDDGESVMEF
jgi:hypothetical protein